MAEDQEKPHAADFRRLRRTLDANAHPDAALPLRDFQKQAEAFWNHPYTRKLREDSGPPPRRRADMATTLNGQAERLRAAIGEDDGIRYELRRSWTLKGGTVVNLAGDDAALPPEPNLTVVTTSSTITTDAGTTSYVEVHVFERSRKP